MSFIKVRNAHKTENTEDYLELISELAQTPIDIISTGPDRNETIVLKNPLT